MQQDLVACMLGNVGLDTEDHTVSDLDDNLVFPFQDAVPIIVALGVCRIKSWCHKHTLRHLFLQTDLSI